MNSFSNIGLDNPVKFYFDPLTNNRRSEYFDPIENKEEEQEEQVLNIRQMTPNQRLKPCRPVERIQFSPLNEQDETISNTVSLLIKTMERGTDLLINGGIDFETAESLKETNIETKKLLKERHISSSTREVLNQVKSQYDAIVESVDVLSNLRKLSKEIRKPELKSTSYGTEKLRPTAYQLTRMFGFEDRIGGIKQYPSIFYDNLGRLYTADKKEWQAKWSSIRQQMWNAAVEADAFLLQDKKITFITGSNSSSIPSILKVGQIAPKLSSKPALIPTGQLVKFNMVPLSGELGFGILNNGVNQNSLSGMRFAGLRTCIDYAAKISFCFNENSLLESLMSNLNMPLKHIRQMIPMIRIEILQLLTTGTHPEAYPEIKAKLNNIIEQLDSISPISLNYLPYWPLVGMPFNDEEGEIPQAKLERGQIVQISRYNEKIYGIIQAEYDDGTCNVILDKNGGAIRINPDYKNLEKIWKVTSCKLRVIPDHLLAEKLANTSPLDEIDMKNIEKKLMNARENFEDILKLFDIITPYWSREEMEQIKSPFPIVWGTTSDTFEFFPVPSDVQGEVGLRGKPILGEEIQVVFTPREHVAELDFMLRGQNVQVMSFDAADYILIHGKKEKYSDLWN